MKTLAEDLADEAERHRRRFVHHTRKRGPMTMEEATALCARVAPWPAEDKIIVIGNPTK